MATTPPDIAFMVYIDGWEVVDWTLEEYKNRIGFVLLLPARAFEIIMKSHLIPNDAIQFLLNDDLKNFCEKRKNMIISEIEKRTRWQNP
jgi:hypothetical protein